MSGNRNMLPEAEQRRFDADLEAEARICSDQPLDDQLLLADRRFRRDLAALAPTPLPASLRRSLTRRLPLRPAWPVAIAASILAAVVLGLSMRSAPPPAPTGAEMRALGYAIVVIGKHSQDGFRRALRHGEGALDRPLLESETLPYLELIRPALPRPAASIPPNQEYAR